MLATQVGQCSITIYAPIGEHEYRAMAAKRSISYVGVMGYDIFSETHLHISHIVDFILFDII